MVEDKVFFHLYFSDCIPISEEFYDNFNLSIFLFTTTMRALTLPLKQLRFWVLKISIWWVIRRIVLTWHRMAFYYFRTLKSNSEVNSFRHLKKRLLHLEWMFWRYLNKSGKSASKIQSYAKVHRSSWGIFWRISNPEI